jgi:hypothetical protein
VPQMTEYMCHKWLNICATNDWIYVPQMTEYMCHKWLNICATNDWIYVPQMTEYMCHKWQPICSLWRNSNSVLSSFMTYHRVNKNNTTGASSGARTAHPRTWIYSHVSVGFVLSTLQFSL